MRNRLSMWHYVKSYKFNSILTKNFILILCLIVIPLSLMGIGVYYYYNSILKQELEASNTQSLSKVRDIMDMIFLETDKLAVRVASDPNVETFVKVSSFNGMDYDFYQMGQSINRSLSISSITSEYIDSIYIYSDINKYLISSSRGSSFIDQFFDNKWIADYTAMRDLGRSEWKIARSFKDVLYFQQGNNFLSTFRTLPLSSRESQGVLVVNINTNMVDKIIRNVSGRDESLMIVDNDGIILCASETGLTNQNINKLKGFEDIFTQTNNNEIGIKSFRGEKQVISVMKSSRNNLIYISLIPLQQYELKLNFLKQFITAVIFFCIVVAILLSFVIAVKVYAPIKSIISILEETNNRESKDVFIDQKGLNELKYITVAIIKKTDTSNQLEEELSNRLIMLRKAQSIALQSQINPHFLYNTLESINWMVMESCGEINPASSMISSLSQLLRLSLETENSFIDLNTEIEHAKRYVEIQKMRYNNKFDTEWEIEEDILQCQIVKITLQPILENAIYHGIKPKRGKCTILVRGYRKEEVMFLEIWDNGVGMPEEEVQRINNRLERQEYVNQDRHIGLMNVNQRIKLGFGEDYGLRVESSTGRGMLVKIVLPCVKNSNPD